MKERDEVQRLEERVEALEQELRAAKSGASLGLAASFREHALLNSARNIMSGIEFVIESESGRLSERAAKLLNNVQEVVHAICSVSVEPPNTSDARRVSLGDFLTDCAGALHGRRVGGDLEVRLEPSPEVHAKIDPVWLRHCIDLIVENAGKAMRDSPEKLLTLGAAAAGDRVEIHIADTGPGVPDALRPQLFRVPVESGERKGKLGFGLLLARTISRGFGGDVRLEEGRRGGAR